MAMLNGVISKMGGGMCWRCWRFTNRLMIVESSVYRGQQFSTTGSTAALNPAKAANKSAAGSGRDRKSQTFILKKKKVETVDRSRKPEIGERKALRKRVVLSNTNALDVPETPEFSLDNLGQTQDRMMVLPGPILDQLRALDAFKPTQAWALFRKPALLIREETTRLAENMQQLKSEKQSRQIILRGAVGSGKTVMLLQAMALAFLQGWTVIHLPEGQDLVNAHTEYSPIEPDNLPTMYNQTTYASKLLASIVKANGHLKDIKLNLDPQSKNIIAATESLTSVSSSMNLSDLARRGVDDASAAPDILKLLLYQLYLPGRPPLLLAADNLTHLMRTSDYRDKEFKLIHAHQLTIVNWFVSQLSGQSEFPNGGLVLAATSSSNCPRNITLTRVLNQRESRKRVVADPHGKSDPLVMSVFESRPSLVTGHAGYEKSISAALRPFTRKSDETPPIEIIRLAGISKVAATNLMEFWARSGLYRHSVDNRNVGWMWTMSDGGVFGQLEKSCIRAYS